MKKLISAALVLALVLSLSVVAFAAGTTVYCDAPDDWTFCNAYTWDAGGAAQSGQWPGTAMTKDDATGLWKIELPATATNVIFNNKEGDNGSQTADLVVPTDNKVKYDYAAKTWVALDEQAVVVEQYYVAGVAALCGEEWAPSAAANAMTKGTDGVWTKAYTNVAAGTYELKVTDGSWDKTWGVYNEAESKVDNVSITLDAASDVTVMFNPTTQLLQIKIGSNTTDYPHPTTGDSTQPTDPSTTPTNPSTTPTNPSTTPTNPSTTPTNPSTTPTQGSTTPTQGSNVTTGNRTLTVKGPSTWTGVKIYTWEPEEFGKWPGSDMPKSGSEYKTQIKNSMKNLIVIGILAGGTQQQTGNITLENNGKDVVITVANDAQFTVTYGAASTGGNGANNGTGSAADPTPTGTPSNYRVVGNADWMGNWDPASDLGRMVETSAGVYKKNFENVAPGSYQLKITKDGKWDNAYGGDNGGNYTFTVTQKCTITVTFTLQGTTGIISVKGTGVPATADISLVSVIVLMGLASAAVVVLFVNKKKFV